MQYIHVCAKFGHCSSFLHKVYVSGAIVCYFKVTSKVKLMFFIGGNCISGGYIFHQLFNSSPAVTLILCCVGVVTAIIMFPFGTCILVLIFYSCGYKFTGTDSTYICVLWGEEGGREGGGRGEGGKEGRREEGKERGDNKGKGHQLKKE